jgi:glycosyltransferase 2 family protein
MLHRVERSRRHFIGTKATDSAQVRRPRRELSGKDAWRCADGKAKLIRNHFSQKRYHCVQHFPTRRLAPREPRVLLERFEAALVMTEDAPPHAEPVEALASRGKLHPLWIVFKTAISLGLFVVVFWRFDFAALWEKSRQLSGALISAVVLLFAVQTVFAAWRWWVILRHHRLGIRFSTTVRICLIGAFFNQLLPSSFGGDVARAWYVYRNGYSKRISIITVLSDRIYGMAMLAGLAIIFFPILVNYSVTSDALIVIGAVIAAASSALMAAFWLDRLPAWTLRWRFMRHLGSLSEATRAVAGDRRAIAPLLGLSFIIHALTILAIVLLLGAIAPRLNLLLCAALVPGIMLMAMVPISIAGWGVRESIMIYGLGLADVPPEVALIASILVGLSLTAVGLLGGVAWLIQVNRDGHRQPMV